MRTRISLLRTLLAVGSLSAVAGLADAQPVPRERSRQAERIRAMYPDAQPMPFPPVDGSPHQGRATKAHTFVTRDLRTGETTRQEGVAMEDVLGRAATPGGEGVPKEWFSPPLDGTGPTDDDTGAAKNFGFWSLVQDPTAGSLPKRVKLWMKFRDTNGNLHDYVASGTLIDPRHVLTAGHCVFSWRDDDNGWVFNAWAETITVAPGYQNDTYPFGTADAVALHSWANWTVDEDYDHDLGVITLDRPIGALTGWYGYGYNTDCDWFEQGTWHHAGWPAEDPFDGEIMYENYGNFDDCPQAGWDNRVAFYLASWGGSSGSGAERGGAVYAVLSTTDRATVTVDCQLTSTKFSHVTGWIDSVTPSTFDLMPLTLQTQPSVQAGDALSGFAFVLHDYSSASASGTWNYEIYLSTDDEISQTDTYVGAGSFPASLGAKGATWVSLTPPVIPASVPAGDYYIGIVLTVGDANVGNNDSSGQEAAPLTVSCPDVPAPPSGLSPPNASTCRARDNLIVSWTNAGLAVNYELQVGKSPATGTVYSTTNNYFSLSGLAASTNYYWRVRAKRGCSDWGSWSGSTSFRTEPDPAVVSTLVGPADGVHCLGSSVTLQWSPLGDADTYDVQVSPVWCYEGTITTGITGTQLTVNSLDPNTTYYWRVRAQTICGSTTAWSSAPGFCWTFKTAPDSVAPPVVVGPADGTTCGSAQTVLHWNHAEDWDHYEVQVGTSCGTGSIYTTSSNGFTPPNLQSEVVYTWRVRTFHECGLTSDWTTCRSFSLDLEPPQNPTTLYSLSHQVQVWSTDNTVDAYWDWGSDNCDGSFPQYATLWDESATTEPTVPTTSGELTLETSPPLPDGQSHWFHVRTVDWAGNLAVGTLHLGPFWIDTTPPSTPAITSTSIPVGLAGDFAELTVTWDAAMDSTSGVAGYSYALDPAIPKTDTAEKAADGTVDTSDDWATIPLQDGSWTFTVRAVDAAGLAGGTSSVQPFFVDSSLPAFLVPAAGQVLSEGDHVNLQWEPTGGSAGGELRLSTDGGQSFTPVAALTSDQIAGGSMSWTVPDESTTQAVFQLHVVFAVAALDAASPIFTILRTTAADEPSPLASATRLEGNRPNPFNPSTSIVYRLAQASTVRLEVFDLQGRLVRMLVSTHEESAGRHEVVWDGTTDAGHRVSSGVYYCRLQTPEIVDTMRMVLVK